MSAPWAKPERRSDTVREVSGDRIRRVADPRAAWNAVERLAGQGADNLHLARDLVALLLHPSMTTALRALADETGVCGGLDAAVEAAIYATGEDDL